MTFYYYSTNSDGKPIEIC